MLTLIVKGQARDAEIEILGRGIVVVGPYIYDYSSCSTLVQVQIQFNQNLFSELKAWMLDRSHNGRPGDLLYYGADPR